MDGCGSFLSALVVGPFLRKGRGAAGAELLRPGRADVCLSVLPYLCNAPDAANPPNCPRAGGR
jgi:hypothetical protein